MIRLEIISNNTIELDILEALKEVDSDIKYSKMSGVHGIGNSHPKSGDSVWPEENFILIIYCDDDIAEKYINAVAEVKSRFKREGIKLFSVPCLEHKL